MSKKKMTEKELKNLKPAKKGEVRNPNGRKGKNGTGGSWDFKTLIRAALEEDYFVYEKDDEGKIKLDEKGKPIVLKRMKKKDALVLAHLSKAIQDKDMQAIREAYDRVDGKVAQPTELTGKDGGPIEHKEAKIKLD